MSLHRPSRALLVTLGIGHLVVGHLTFTYPASFFAGGWVWGCGAIAAGAACLVAAVAPLHPRLMAITGALIVAHAAGKGAAYVAEAASAPSPVPRASMLAGGAVYGMLALVVWSLWLRVMVPSAAAGRGSGGR